MRGLCEQQVSKNIGMAEVTLETALVLFKINGHGGNGGGGGRHGCVCSE